MPWCEDCARYFTPSAMKADGSCPSCGRVLADPKPASTITAANLNLRKLAAGPDGNEDDLKAPWHFKLLMFCLIVYLAWRFIQIFT